MSLGVCQLDGLDATQVVVVPGSDGRSDLVKYQAHLLLPGPLAVAGLLREGGLEDQLVRLVVEVVVQIVPQQAVDQDSLEILEKLKLVNVTILPITCWINFCY